jgi:predicted trehalose synthase
MLRSFAYAASVSTFGGTDEASANAWEARARDEFLAGYLPVAEPARILPSGRESLEKLLTLFELEKAVYELRYELDHRPEWVRVPVAVILRLLDEPLGVNA